MDSRQWLGLQATHNPYRWVLPVKDSLCTDGGFLFGGCGLAAAVSAMEDTSGRRAVWATGQYLSYAKPGEVMDIDVTVAVNGHQITQARAVCHVGDREILTVNAALGDRDVDARGQWASMPTGIPGPHECRRREPMNENSNHISGQMDQRLVKGRELEELDGSLSDGQVLMWARIPEVIEGVDTATLAVLGDFVPMGVGQALGIRGGGNSLDNTLRIGRLVPTEWVLLDIRITMVERGFGHGSVRMFAEDGTLLAEASQSCIVRYWDRMPRRQ